MRAQGRVQALAVGAILGINVFLMRGSFYLTHAIGDERAYVGVAMKLDKRGFAEYNLMGIDLAARKGFLEYVYSGDEKGRLLARFEAEGTPFYNQPLFHSPPLFPWLLVLSHRLFSPGQGYRVLPVPSSMAERIDDSEKFSGQFYCCIVPLLSGVFLVLCSFLIGKALFSTGTGFFAALLITVSPIHILASRRIWADETLSLLVACAMLLFYFYAKKGKIIYLVSSAVCFALSLLTKNSALVALVPLAYCYYAIRKGSNKDAPAGHEGLAAFLAIAFLLALPWYVAAVRAFGTPFFNPAQPGISTIHPWFSFINSRPWYTHLLGIPYQVPLYALGYFSIAAVLFARERKKEAIFLSVWFLSYLTIVTFVTRWSEMLGPDHRYMLPAYPALAVLSGNCLERIRVSLDERTRFAGGAVAVALLLALCAAWSLRIAFDYVQLAVIPEPF